MITPRDRLNTANTMRDMANVSRQVRVCIPTFTDTDYDSDIQAPYDISEVGRTVTWVVYKVSATLNYATTDLVAYGQAPPGAQIGDSFLIISDRDKDVFEKAKAEIYAYVISGSSYFRVTSLNEVAIGKHVRWSATLESYKPTKYVAPGN